METRNVKVTLETAQRWYQQGGEFKGMALSAYTEAELTPVKNEWESKILNRDIEGYYFNPISRINGIKTKCFMYHKSTFKTEKQAKSALAYAQLTQLMALPEYNGDWVADFSKCESKYIIYRVNLRLSYMCTMLSFSHIAFRDEEICRLFMLNNFDLLKQYFELD